VINYVPEKAAMTKQEKNMVREALELVDARPEVLTPSVEFKRSWAFGNAGLEDERITREQVADAIKE
jgi:hypothetical protein